MRITIFAAGSRGDIQPCVMLGRGLQRAGFDVLLAVPENFAALVQEYELRFHPLRGDVQQIMASETGRRFMEDGDANPLKQVSAMRKMLGPVALQMAEDAFEACRNADAMISLAIFATFAKTITEVLSIPLINVEPTPLLPTRAFPAAGWPLQKNLGGLNNRLSGIIMLQIIWQWYRPFVNSFRRRFGLPPHTSTSFYHILKTTPLLGAYSSTVIPHPSDWPESMYITGYWLPDADTEWQPPPELESFLDAGDPPIYVGFGSMSGLHPERLAHIILEALVISGQRGLLLTGWGGIHAISAPNRVFVINSAPHSWLFSRMAAVAHHGGAGTTAEGLRSGAPSVILPFMMDQPFWGSRVNALGAGTKPIPMKKLTAERLAHAIHVAVTQPAIKERAARIGAAIRAENGVDNAVRVIKERLGE